MEYAKKRLVFVLNLSLSLFLRLLTDVKIGYFINMLEILENIPEAVFNQTPQLVT